MRIPFVQLRHPLRPGRIAWAVVGVVDAGMGLLLLAPPLTGPAILVAAGCFASALAAAWLVFCTADPPKGAPDAR